VLSQNTNDRNRDIAYERLRERFDSWDAVRDAPIEEVEDASSGGLAPTSRCASSRSSTHSTATTWSGWHARRSRGRERSCRLPGVGRKTAACVLLFAYGLPDIPVDTHVTAGRHTAWPVGPGSFEEMHDDALRFLTTRRCLRVPRAADPARAAHLPRARPHARSACAVDVPYGTSCDRAAFAAP
jgi:endonuclease-3